MRYEWIGGFSREEKGTTTVEFVAISGFFFVIAFMIIEIALAIFWWQTAEVAAQIGARYAVVWDPVTTSVSSAGVNGLNAAGIYGQSCNISQGANDPCAAFATAICDGSSGAGCNTVAFNAVLAKMQAVFGALRASNVKITYSYVGLGFAGGPIVPAVTVTISNVPFVSGFADLLGAFFGPSPLTTVPAMSVTLTGEDLSSAGV